MSPVCVVGRIGGGGIGILGDEVESSSACQVLSAIAMNCCRFSIDFWLTSCSLLL